MIYKDEIVRLNVKKWGSKLEILNPILHLLGSKKSVFMLKYAEEGF